MIALLLLIAAFILYYIKVFRYDQRIKNKAKQEAAERAEADRVLSEVPTYFLYRNCGERCYEAFADTPLMEDKIVIN